MAHNFINEKLSILNLKHYTNTSSLQEIFKHKTWQLSCILNMNDRKECMMGNIEKEDYSNIFIASFSSSKNENHAMWSIYGSNNNLSKDEEAINKVLIELNPNRFLAKAFIDEENIILYNKSLNKTYSCVLWDDNGGAYNVDEYVIWESAFTNIIYLESDDDVFSQIYKREINFNGSISYAINKSKVGKFKTKAWEYENEVRILFETANPPTEPFIDNVIRIPLKNEFFRNMIIYRSPWDTSKICYEKINKIIRNSELPEDIIESIHILPSTEEGMFNTKG